MLGEYQIAVHAAQIPRHPHEEHFAAARRHPLGLAIPRLTLNLASQRSDRLRALHSQPTVVEAFQRHAMKMPQPKRAQMRRKERRTDLNGYSRMLQNQRSHVFDRVSFGGHLWRVVVVVRQVPEVFVFLLDAVRMMMGFFSGAICTMCV